MTNLQLKRQRRRCDNTHTGNDLGVGRRVQVFPCFDSAPISGLTHRRLVTVPLTSKLSVEVSNQQALEARHFTLKIPGGTRGYHKELRKNLNVTRSGDLRGHCRVAVLSIHSF